jgi:phage tail-like protein
MLPGLYQEDEFAQRLTSAFDEVLAPVLCTLDNRNAYFDPALAPDDFVRWLAQWVGVSLDENWPLDRQRALVSHASELYRGRGTVTGLASQVELYTGATPEIEENGGCSWSPTPNGSLPGRPIPGLVVRVRQRKRAPLDPKRIEAIVSDARPAHVPFRVEMVEA